MTVEQRDNPSSVLLVDSELAVRLALAEYLRECGLRVIEAATTEEAILAIRSSGRAIETVLCSVTANGSVNGFGLAQWVRKNHPEIDVALAGSIEAAAGAAADICEEAPHLIRPYQPQSVVDHIKRLRATRNRHLGNAEDRRP